MKFNIILVAVASLLVVQVASAEIDDQRATETTSTVKAAGDKTPECRFCKVLVGEMLKMIRDNKTEENIRDSLDKVCELIFRRKDRRDRCEEMVNAYYKELIDMLADESDPQMICTLLDQCNHPGLFQPRPDVNPFQSSTEIRQNRRKDNADIPNFGDFISKVSSGVRSFKTCVECKMFVKYLHDSVEDPASQTSVKDFLMKTVCDSLDDASLKDSCTKMVDKYSIAFLKAVGQELNPDAACIELGACFKDSIGSILTIDNGFLTLDPIPEPPKRQQKPKVRANEVCDQCVDIITKIDEYISTHAIDHDVSVIIDQVCHQMPCKPLKEQCTLIVKTIGKDIAQAVSFMDNPRQLCSKLMLCPNSADSVYIR